MVIYHIASLYQKNMEINHKIRQVRQQLRLSQKEMAEKLDLDQSYISDIERGKASISGNVLRLLHDILGISADWLISGKGSPFVKHSNASDVEVYVDPNVDLHQKLHFVRGPESGLERPVGGVPVVQHSRAAAGLPVGTAAGELLEDMGWLQLPGLPLTHGQWVAVYADGESMQPTVQDGDLLVCRRLEDALYLRQNTVCVVCTADNAIVKRVRLKGTTLLMSSDNPSYEPYTLPGHEVTQLWEVIRRVTGHLDPLPPFSAELESRIAALEKRRK
jgi:transcriptional regulator with XRE-family HTH domain